MRDGHESRAQDRARSLAHLWCQSLRVWPDIAHPEFIGAATHALATDREALLSTRHGAKYHSAIVLRKLRKLTDEFWTSLDYLPAGPLCSADIHFHLESFTVNGAHLKKLLETIGEKAALKKVGDTTENLLNFSETLTDRYELAMRILIGDRMGRIH